MLDEEVFVWREALAWDMRPAAAAVRRHLATQSLQGFALCQGQELAGYCYYVRDGGKGLLGDLYVMAKWNSPDREGALLEAALEALWQSPGVNRVEAQLLLLGAEPSRGRLPFSHRLSVFPRQLLEFSASGAAHLEDRRGPEITILPWTEARQEDSARLVAVAYSGHVDSDINDQYRSPAGARRFLSNIVQYPGCGNFFAPASYMALDRGALCGISLASLIAERTGHITQLCVAPSHRERGVGYALLRRSLLALAAQGCTGVSLTVTRANHHAVRFYRRMGFLPRREFAAYVWES